MTAGNMNASEKLSIAKASIQASTKGDEELAHLLRNVAEGMFGEQPKGISLEHFQLMTEREWDGRDFWLKGNRENGNG